MKYDATKQELLIEIDRLKKLTETDELTGIANRRRFSKCIRKSISSGEDFAVLALDLDHFKRINDEYGHYTGDMVLKEFANFIIEFLKETNSSNSPHCFARWGGEEFMILVTSEHQYCHIPDEMDRIRSYGGRLGRMIRFSTFSSVDDVTVSLGATLYKKDETIDSLLTRVDDALYKAKGNGRDRTEVL